MSYQPAISKFFKSNSKNSAKRSASGNGNIGSPSPQPVTGSRSQSSGFWKDAARKSGDGTAEKHEANAADPARAVSKVAKAALSEYSFTRAKSIEDAPSRRGIQESDDFSEKVQSALRKRASGTLDREADQDSSTDAAAIEPASKKSRKSDKLTPLDQQVKDLKLQHMDKILAVRVGYKYKFFAMDAVIVSKILQIMLISGKLTLDDSHPGDRSYKQLAYCSIPDNRLQVHLQRLLRHNLKVGVVEQAETQAIKRAHGTSSGVFRRKVDKVFTKATFSINETFNCAEANSTGELSTIWALKVAEDEHFFHFWLLSVQLSSGEVIHDKFSDRKKMSAIELDKRISYLSPIEVVSRGPLPEVIVSFIKKRQSEVQFYDLSTSEPEAPQGSHLGGIKLPEELLELRATLRHYLENYDTHKILDILHNYKPFDTKTNMILSPNTLESLEIFENQTDLTTRGSLMWILDHTRTPYGYRLLREWISRPLTDKNEINKRLDAIECARKEITSIFMEALSNMLKDTPDFLKNLNRISYGQTSRQEVYVFLKHLDKIAKHFISHHYYLQEQVFDTGGRVHQRSTLLTSVLQQLDDALRKINVTHLLNMINVEGALDKNKEKSCNEFFDLNNYENAEVIISKLRDIDSVKEELQRELERIRRVLRRPRFFFKDEIEYLIEVRNTQLNGLPTDWVKVASTKTLSRFRTPETTKLVNQLEYHKNLLTYVCDEEFKKFLVRISADYAQLRDIINKLATFDCILSISAASFNRNYVRPKFSENSRQINIKNGRNPIIESLDVNYVANDVHMKEDANKLMIITGPNMGGKSSFIRQVALIGILAQIGSFVPADSAEIPIFNNVFTRIGAHDNLIKGDSTFKVEMLEMLDILKNCNENSLLLLDEVGRGTGTTDGVSISYAIIKHFTSMETKCPFILFITHYPILGSITSPLLDNYHMSFIEERRPGERWPTAVFLYKLTRGLASDSYGLNVARLANIPTDIINKAFEISEQAKFEMEGDKHLRFISAVKAALLDKGSSYKEKLLRLLEIEE
ncbi:DNA mismatch repair protein MSH3 [Lachancea thermotolerans]